MGVFPSFLSVVQENAAISAELLGRAGEAGGDWRPKAACSARSYSAQGQPDPATRWDQQVPESRPNRTRKARPNRTGTPRTPYFSKAQDGCPACAACKSATVLAGEDSICFAFFFF